jgi:hypothetical protein
MKTEPEGQCSPIPACAVSALFAAAAALPILALPVSAGAQLLENELVPAMLPPGAAIGARVLWYRESNGRMRVTEPVGWLKSPIGENWEVAVSGLVDMVSGASTFSVSNQSGRPTQILTGASITDRRNAGDVNVTRKWDGGSVGLTRTQSTEKDYTSDATSVNATFDFNERNTTLASGLGESRDEVRSSDDHNLNERRRSHEFLLGFTQLLDRNALVQSNLVYTRQTGYLNDPYRQTISFYRDGLFPPIVQIRDTRPDHRAQLAWLTRFKRTLPAQRAVVTTEYRYFRDDWGIRAHTFYSSWLQTLNDTWKVEAALRYYSQGPADFYFAQISQRPAPRYASSDQRLAGFGSLEPALKLILQVTPGTAIDLGIGRYQQRAHWKLGGGGSPFHEPLSANTVNAGFVHRF